MNAHYLNYLPHCDHDAGRAAWRVTCEEMSTLPVSSLESVIVHFPEGDRGRDMAAWELAYRYECAIACMREVRSFRGDRRSPS